MRHLLSAKGQARYDALRAERVAGRLSADEFLGRIADLLRDMRRRVSCKLTKNTSGLPSAYVRAVFYAALRRAKETHPGLSGRYTFDVRGRNSSYFTGCATVGGRRSTHTVPKPAAYTKTPDRYTRELYWLFLHELWHNAGVRHRDYPRNLMKMPADDADPVFAGAKGLPPAPFPGTAELRIP